MTRWFDRLVIVFFLAHIPTTLFFDSQGVLPEEWFPKWAVQVNQNYISDFGDPLMRELPPWFRCLVWMEVALQLPFFFVGAYAFLRRRNWVRWPALLYGVNVASTMVPILGELALSPRTDFNRPVLLAIYAPFLLVPLGIAVRMAGGPPFARGAGARRKSKGH
jgi:hypothetical protein